MNDSEFIKTSFSQAELKTRYNIDNYHKSLQIGHSRLVNFEIYGPTSLRPDFEIKKSDAMIFGSIVDALLTRPEYFEDEFTVVSDDEKLSPSEKKLIDYCCTIDDGLFLDWLHSSVSITEELPSIKDKLLDIMNAAEFFMTRKNETRLNKIDELKSQIYTYYYSSKSDKQTITQTQCKEAAQCVEAIKNSELTKFIFEDPTLYYSQVQIFGNDTKALFDLIYIDPINKVIHPIDLKTTVKPEREFIANSFYTHKYYRQAEMYTALLRNWLNMQDLYDWEIADFKFLVICKDTLAPTLYSFPVRYTDDNQLIISKNKTVPPYTKIIADMCWHTNSKQYMYPRSVYIELLKHNSDKNSFITIPIIDTSSENTKDSDYLIID